ncbi:hypothetical protein NDU88_001341 [Pleurodeles waltl]|uniref:Secreted protein n=1 Tax=Pleurodeles waltl TaxID=8319 RepID=A0AAV7SCP8_PLEWA|nr:hypothetical protein NDU88_001341 [Pleurodeles waltl]
MRYGVRSGGYIIKVGGTLVVLYALVTLQDGVRVFTITRVLRTRRRVVVPGVVSEHPPLYNWQQGSAPALPTTPAAAHRCWRTAPPVHDGPPVFVRGHSVSRSSCSSAPPGEGQRRFSL